MKSLQKRLHMITFVCLEKCVCGGDGGAEVSVCGWVVGEERGGVCVCVCECVCGWVGG